MDRYIGSLNYFEIAYEIIKTRHYSLGIMLKQVYLYIGALFVADYNARDFKSLFSNVHTQILSYYFLFFYSALVGVFRNNNF